MAYYCTKCGVTHYSGEDFKNHTKFKGKKPAQKKKTTSGKKKSSVMQQFHALEGVKAKVNKYFGTTYKTANPKSIISLVETAVKNALKAITFTENDEKIAELTKRIDSLALQIEELKIKTPEVV